MKKSLIPKGFTAGGRSWRITTSRKAVANYVGPDLDENDGVTFIRHDTVWLEPALSDDLIRHTLLHELCHVSTHISGANHILHAKHTSGQEHDPEEDYVTIVSAQLWPILKANPHLVAFLWPTDGGTTADVGSVG